MEKIKLTIFLEPETNYKSGFLGCGMILYNHTMFIWKLIYEETQWQTKSNLPIKSSTKDLLTFVALPL